MISPTISPPYFLSHIIPHEFRWLSQKEELEEVPKTIPAASAAYLSTRAGLLFNEMQYSPEPVRGALGGALGGGAREDYGRWAWFIVYSRFIFFL